MTDVDTVLTTAEKLNLETAKIPWNELQRLYAQGVVLVISPNIDLVTVASAFVDDLAEQVKVWLESGDIRKSTDDDARTWHEQDITMWAVAAAPWVLVQEEPKA
ncbi:DUF2288 domain-containing protein [Parendozoicomonas sp. Alg238-R29]|uniref:DUF2288 domain-containing protein n=1 Tax=Parendozoicomonas sp. Alg238-R29 TaxID=2993446 RepID=UPI00248D5415|nr:DUF2288 domain-containing protein [Parendozoicomonas sp. Alg238-R29]